MNQNIRVLKTIKRKIQTKIKYLNYNIFREGSVFGLIIPSILFDHASNLRATMIYMLLHFKLNEVI